MRVCELKLNHFRNYRELTFAPGARLNILYGSNAQGKSNVLEAISLLATSRSLRAGRESELIYSDAEMSHVTAEVDREREGDVELQVSVFQGDKKAVRINGLKRPRVIDLLGQFNAVFFGSLDLSIVTGEPTDRRHYLNVEISQISPRYVLDLGHYKRVLQQRNRLLRDLRDRPRPPADVGLDTWTEQLIRFGAPLLEKRRFYIERLSPLAAQIHRELTDGRETLEIRYLPSFALPPPQAEVVPAALAPSAPPDTVREMNPEERYLAEAQSEAEAERGAEGGPKRSETPLSATDIIAGAFRAQLTAMGYEEARRGSTLLGPQRDDLSFFLNGADARIYGSQGQQRTVALSLKLAEFRLIEDYVGEPPVLLLDDVMSDLDDARRRHLLKWIRNRGQIFITCTNLRSFPKEILAEATTFHVVSGTVTPDGSQRTQSSQSLSRSSVQSPSDAPAEPGIGERVATDETVVGTDDASHVAPRLDTESDPDARAGSERADAIVAPSEHSKQPPESGSLLPHTSERDAASGSEPVQTG